MLKLMLSLFLLFMVNISEAASRILFIPLDNRPVSLANSVDTMRAAGWEVLVPPTEYIASNDREGDPDKLFAWLEQNVRGSSAIVASSDSLIYGGLVASRTHLLEETVLKDRTERLIAFKKQNLNIPFYIFTTVMRSPKMSSAPVEPDYYLQYGPQLFRLGALRDLNEVEKLTKIQKKEMENLIAAIPQEVLDDFYTRRSKNLEVTKKLLMATEQSNFDYMLLGRDDTAPFSDAHREARRLTKITYGLEKRTVRFFAGADQLGLVLLNRAANRMYGIVPIVYAFYNKGKGAETVPSYEDDQVGRNVRSQILAAGAWPATISKRADLILAVNTPFDGVTPSADTPLNNQGNQKKTEYLVTEINDYLKTNQVAVADVAYGNGSDNALVDVLLKEKLMFKLAAYGGWNTAANTIGFALVQGLQASNMSQLDHDTILITRLLDDWVYQSNVRGSIRQKIVWPNGWSDGKFTLEQKLLLEQQIKRESISLAESYLQDLQEWHFILPWNRTFEVQVQK